jgi:hypothetical protein
MSNWQLTAPVALLIFNRPQTTRRVFQEIRKARPPRLLIVADGPRLDRPHEAQLCRETRAIIESVDWPCEVLTDYSEVNLGCRERVASGLDWVFSRVKESIILEDDCLPHPSFFRYCDELLTRYRDDRRVGTITGTNLQSGTVRGSASYYFSKYPCVWGWASWERAWVHYDASASVWPEFQSSGALRAWTQTSERIYWERAFDGVYRRAIDTWDYQLALACWAQSMLSVVPNHNLISNIGFGADATHTTQVGALANLPVNGLSFPLTHPRLMLADRGADEFVAARVFNERLRGKIRRYLGLTRRRPQARRPAPNQAPVTGPAPEPRAGA